jgi:sigma-B regulation protein RsbU (phosphoserine phosphatase)
MWGARGVLGNRLARRTHVELMYIILLTVRAEMEDLAMALAAEANDYIAKPFHPVELESRVRVGQRMVNLQRTLTSRIADLEEALAHVRHLQGLLPICSYCKKVRNEDNYWQQVESYITSHSDLGGAVQAARTRGVVRGAQSRALTASRV